MGTIHTSKRGSESTAHEALEPGNTAGRRGGRAADSNTAQPPTVSQSRAFSLGPRLVGGDLVLQPRSAEPAHPSSLCPIVRCGALTAIPWSFLARLLGGVSGCGLPAASRDRERLRGATETPRPLRIPRQSRLIETGTLPRWEPRKGGHGAVQDRVLSENPDVIPPIARFMRFCALLAAEDRVRTFEETTIVAELGVVERWPSRAGGGVTGSPASRRTMPDDPGRQSLHRKRVRMHSHSCQAMSANNASELAFPG